MGDWNDDRSDDDREAIREQNVRKEKSLEWCCASIWAWQEGGSARKAIGSLFTGKYYNQNAAVKAKTEKLYKKIMSLPAHEKAKFDADILNGNDVAAYARVSIKGKLLNL
ncbi:MAG: hypothetical protein JAY74_25480 [Candidatus Thiodiazotropha taylori]|nr:hypothetical protein [Candidatus Thiodiazotropha taylori]